MRDTLHVTFCGRQLLRLHAVEPRHLACSRGLCRLVHEVLGIDGELAVGGFHLVHEPARRIHRTDQRIERMYGHAIVETVGVGGRATLEERHRWPRGTEFAGHVYDVALGHGGYLRRPFRRTVLQLGVPPFHQAQCPTLLEQVWVDGLSGLEEIDTVDEVANEFAVPQPFRENDMGDR